MESFYQTLARIGYTHPLHPTLTHLVMGLVMGAFIFILIAAFFRRESLARTAWHCIILAVIALLPTAVLGYADWQHSFAGDLIFANYFPYAGDPTCNPEKYIKALQIMKNLNAEFIIPGHGKALKGKNSLDIYIDFFKEFRKSIKNAIEDNIPLEKIDIPHKFEVFRDDMKKSSIEHWYNFFKKSEDLS